MMGNYQADKKNMYNLIDNYAKAGKYRILEIIIGVGFEIGFGRKSIMDWINMNIEDGRYTIEEDILKLKNGKK